MLVTWRLAAGLGSGPVCAGVAVAAGVAAVVGAAGATPGAIGAGGTTGAVATGATAGAGGAVATGGATGVVVGGAAASGGGALATGAGASACVALAVIPPSLRTLGVGNAAIVPCIICNMATLGALGSHGSGHVALASCSSLLKAPTWLTAAGGGGFGACGCWRLAHGFTSGAPPCGRGADAGPR